jgi:hypothetical protein
MAPLENLAHAPPRSHKRPKIAISLGQECGEKSQRLVLNLGNPGSIPKISRLFMQSELDGPIMLLLGNVGSEFLEDECDRGF